MRRKEDNAVVPEWLPGMREELLETLRALSDRQYQEQAWIRHEPPHRQDNFDLAVHFLFDDTCLAERPRDGIGWYLRSKTEAAAVELVVKAIERLFAHLGKELSDEAYMKSAQWNDVVNAAKNALEVLTASDRFVQ